MPLLAADFEERDPAVKALLSMAIKARPAQGKDIGICGQGASDNPDFKPSLIGPRLYFIVNSDNSLRRDFCFDASGIGGLEVAIDAQAVAI